MTARPTAGARIRILIEDTVESADGDLQLTNGAAIQGWNDPNAMTVDVIAPGWQLGDIVHDGHDQLVRIDKGDGVHVWQRPNGYVTYDDETSLASLRIIRRADQ